MDHINDAYEDQRIRDAFSLPPEDGRITIEIDLDGSAFRDSWCDRTHTPAAVHVDYYRNHTDDEGDWISAEKGSYSWDIARDEIAAILADPSVGDDDILISVNAWFLVYGLKVAA